MKKPNRINKNQTQITKNEPNRNISVLYLLHNLQEPKIEKTKKTETEPK